VMKAVRDVWCQCGSLCEEMDPNKFDERPAMLAGEPCVAYWCARCFRVVFAIVANNVIAVQMGESDEKGKEISHSSKKAKKEKG